MIDASINKQFLNHDLNMFVNVEIEVVEGRVLLTGSVKKTKHRLDAIKLSWKVLGVREVINEIDVTDKGGTEFLHQDVTLQAKGGTIVIWPPWWTHYHKSQVSPTQVKYIMTGWMEYDS